MLLPLTYEAFWVWEYGFDPPKLAFTIYDFGHIMIPPEIHTMWGPPVVNWFINPIQLFAYHKPQLVGGIPTPLKNMKVSWDDDIPNMEK